MNLIKSILSPVNKMQHFTRGEFSAFAEVEQNRQKFVNMPREEKRKLYKCKEKYITVDKILTWPEYAQKNKIFLSEPEENVSFEINEELNSKIGVFEGDITSLEIDAIVNAAKNTLLGFLFC